VTRRAASASGKIILSGEYAVVFGYPGIAVPSPLLTFASFEEDEHILPMELKFSGITGGDDGAAYLRKIIDALGPHCPLPPRGTLTITNHIPIRKGMGSSTALVIAVTRCLLDKGKREEARAVEDQVNPGHSGIDFTVIWEHRPILFQRGTEPVPITVSQDIRSAILIDTGTPNEKTPELVAWVKERGDDPRVKHALEEIGRCTERVRKGEDLRTVFPDHHRAQVALGVIPKAVQTLIAEIKHLGGAAKVIGAGGRTGGGGLVLALHANTDILKPAIRRAKFTSFPLLATPV
jgi:mevalonate kinase